MKKIASAKNVICMQLVKNEEKNTEEKRTLRTYCKAKFKRRNMDLACLIPFIHEHQVLVMAYIIRPRGFQRVLNDAINSSKIFLNPMQRLGFISKGLRGI